MPQPVAAISTVKGQMLSFGCTTLSECLVRAGLLIPCFATTKISIDSAIRRIERRLIGIVLSGIIASPCYY